MHWACITLISHPCVYEMAMDQGATGLCREQWLCQALCSPDTPTESNKFPPRLC